MITFSLLCIGHLLTLGCFREESIDDSYMTNVNEKLYFVNDVYNPCTYKYDHTKSGNMVTIYNNFNYLNFGSVKSDIPVAAVHHKKNEIPN